MSKLRCHPTGHCLMDFSPGNFSDIFASRSSNRKRSRKRYKTDPRQARNRFDDSTKSANAYQKALTLFAQANDTLTIAVGEGPHICIRTRTTMLPKV
jgi:hypothetical protein